jgi:GlpG protein
MTAAVLLLTFIAAKPSTLLGDNLATVSWLGFVDYRVQGDYIYLSYLGRRSDSGQWWQLPADVDSLRHLAWR